MRCFETEKDKFNQLRFKDNIYRNYTHNSYSAYIIWNKLCYPCFNFTILNINLNNIRLYYRSCFLCPSFDRIMAGQKNQ